MIIFIYIIFTDHLRLQYFMSNCCLELITKTKYIQMLFMSLSSSMPTQYVRVAVEMPEAFTL